MKMLTYHVLELSTKKVVKSIKADCGNCAAITFRNDRYKKATHILTAEILSGYNSRKCYFK